ncbi:MAG: hypothetical protein Q8Q86_00170 [Candidatus Daviesbacteria bacterium]|nr:hypothetical protein [Candidatus Daviesbacteria bacterium]
MAISFLAECMPNTQARFSVNFPNYVNSFFGFVTFFFEDVDPEDYPKWTWDDLTRKFVKTKAGELSDELKTKSHLAEGKREVIKNIINNLNFVRSNNMTALNLQELIYADKRTQAQAFKDSGYNESVLIKYPYVEQYADFAKITPRLAADDILFKAEMHSQFIANTELLRLCYFNLVKKATTTGELKKILDEFLSDCYYNPQKV